MQVTQLMIFVVSDAIGETAELVTKAAVSQFPHVDQVRLKRFSNIEDSTQLREIAQLAGEKDAMIVYTLVQQSMVEELRVYCEEFQVASYDLMTPLIDIFRKRLQQEPLEEPGLVRQLDDDYFKKIEAIDFAVRYDDGRDPRGILKADIVLLGISRTSKTPLSQYLAHQRLKVANVPLVPEVDPPEELKEIDPRRCFGLVISPEKLNCIRKERLKSLGLGGEASYAKVERIEQEIEHFEKVTEELDCYVLDVTNRAVEETANEILNEWTKHFTI